jgi:uncharacterized protein YqjF (DUF2071 family)
MDVCNNFIVDRRPTPGSMVSLTPYELWQLERYGNFISESESIDPQPGKTWLENQIEIDEYNQSNNG